MVRQCLFVVDNIMVSYLIYCMYICIYHLYTHTIFGYIYIYKLLYPPASSQSRERPPPKKKYKNTQAIELAILHPAVQRLAGGQWPAQHDGETGEVAARERTTLDAVSNKTAWEASSKVIGMCVCVMKVDELAYMSADFARLLTMWPQLAPREALARRALVWKERVRGIRACARARAAIIFAVGPGGGMALMLFLSRAFFFFFSRVRAERS